jgi:hypothetical protein
MPSAIWVPLIIERHFDQRLDFYVEPQHKSRHVKALLKLSRASGLYPKCFVLQGIEIEPHPIARGGYGDVYKGLLHGREIAVKALRIYKTSDLVKLLKVMLCFLKLVDISLILLLGILVRGCLMAAAFPP